MSKLPEAVALHYDQESAPKVVASGTGDIAQEIVDIANAHGIPLYENAELVRMLAQLELGEEIPDVLYRLIAEIIAFAFYLQGKAPNDFS